MRQVRGCASILIACATLAASAGAEIVNSTGKVDWLTAAPSDARLRGAGSITGSMLMRAWDETQNITLPRPITVDAVDPGRYDRASRLGTFTIDAGTDVSSHAVLLKPPGSLAMAEAKLSFATEILGVIVTDATSARRLDGRLAASDWLGGSTAFDSNLLNRGLEIGSDWFEISADRLSITFNLTASNPGDFARILTRSSFPLASDPAGFGGSSGMLLWDWGPTPVPTPGPAVLLAISGGLLLRRRRP